MEFLPNIMPEGFIKNTLPFAKSEPSIIEGLDKITLFKTMELLFGWINFTISFVLILKLL